MLKILLNVYQYPGVATPVRYFSANTANITKAHRKSYTRTYPTVMILADGSSINIKYHEPRKIIKMPLDITLLSESERKERIEKRKPKTQIKLEEEIFDSFNSKKYLSFIKDGPKRR